jgi:hypothetical protein
LLAADPADADMRALALLAAHRSQNEPVIYELLSARPALEPLTTRGREWLEQLLRERGLEQTQTN